ncbi:uncharacterized protein LOC121261299 [Juglans microcarpa x Juglans regia]|uniref:uncharacterized protein LOC121261299 n=1 Tax=Juglans microcarpa x Juglans regia TaxID=2249226 RepID=UPI001B7F3F8E|nr:uncharacterized protein LOC121261299 [Juglans microcarpa x Juglans regia]
MVFTTSCCLNVSPTSKAPQVAWKKNELESWRSSNGPCVLIGMASASMIIGLEISNVSVIFDQTHIAANEYTSSSSSTLVVAESNGRGKAATKWSDKRSCPAWRVNSLETIVPENLPRPSARRRWEAIGFDSKTAPPVKVAVGKTSSSPNCFSL